MVEPINKPKKVRKPRNDKGKKRSKKTIDTGRNYGSGKMYRTKGYTGSGQALITQMSQQQAVAQAQQAQVMNELVKYVSRAMVPFKEPSPQGQASGAPPPAQNTFNAPNNQYLRLSDITPQTDIHTEFVTTPAEMVGRFENIKNLIEVEKQRELDKTLLDQQRKHNEDKARIMEEVAQADFRARQEIQQLDEELGAVREEVTRRQYQYEQELNEIGNALERTREQGIYELTQERARGQQELKLQQVENLAKLTTQSAIAEAMGKIQKIGFIKQSQVREQLQKQELEQKEAQYRAERQEREFARVSNLTNDQVKREIRKIDPNYEPNADVDVNRYVLLTRLGYEPDMVPTDVKGRRQVKIVPKGEAPKIEGAEFKPEPPPLPERNKTKVVLKPKMVSTTTETEPQEDYKSMFEEERLKNQELGQYVEQQITGLEEGIGTLLAENELLKQRPEMQSMETQTQPLEETKKIEELTRGLQNLSQEVIRNQELQTRLQKAKIEEEQAMARNLEQERIRNQQLKEELKGTVRQAKKIIKIGEYQQAPQQSAFDYLYSRTQLPPRTVNTGTDPILTSDFGIQVKEELKRPPSLAPLLPPENLAPINPIPPSQRVASPQSRFMSGSTSPKTIKPHELAGSPKVRPRVETQAESFAEPEGELRGIGGGRRMSQEDLLQTHYKLAQKERELYGTTKLAEQTHRSMFSYLTDKAYHKKFGAESEQQAAAVSEPLMKEFKGNPLHTGKISKKETIKKLQQDPIFKARENIETMTDIDMATRLYNMYKKQKNPDPIFLSEYVKGIEEKFGYNLDEGSSL